jgi:hypothetical protein
VLAYLCPGWWLYATPSGKTWDFWNIPIEMEGFCWENHLSMVEFPVPRNWVEGTGCGSLWSLNLGLPVVISWGSPRHPQVDVGGSVGHHSKPRGYLGRQGHWAEILAGDPLHQQFSLMF